MAAGGMLAGMMVGNNLERLKAGLAAASVAWKDLEPRGLALGIEAMSGIPALASKQRPTLGGTVDGVDCTVQVLSDMVHYAHTRVVAQPLGHDPALVGVHPNPAGILGKIRSWLGQDIVVGEP